MDPLFKIIRMGEDRNCETLSEIRLPDAGEREDEEDMYKRRESSLFSILLNNCGGHVPIRFSFQRQNRKGKGEYEVRSRRSSLSKSVKNYGGHPLQWYGVSNLGYFDIFMIKFVLPVPHIEREENVCSPSFLIPFKNCGDHLP